MSIRIDGRIISAELERDLRDLGVAADGADLTSAQLSQLLDVNGDGRLDRADAFTLRSPHNSACGSNGHMSNAVPMERAFERAARFLQGRPGVAPMAEVNRRQAQKLDQAERIHRNWMEGACQEAIAHPIGPGFTVDANTRR